MNKKLSFGKRNLPLAIVYFVYVSDKFPEPKSLCMKTFFVGIALCIPAAFLNTYFIWDQPNPYDYIYLAGLTEESLKFLALYIFVKRQLEFNEPMDALVYSVAASIGFAVYENWEYVISGSEVSLKFAKDIALIRAFSAVPLHALTGVFMGFFLIEAIFDKINKKLFLFLALFFPICLHGLYNLILSSNNFSTYWIYILLIVFIIRAYFVFKKERNLQKFQNNRFSKTIPTHSDIIFSIFVSGFILFSFNYFVNFVLYQ